MSDHKKAKLKDEIKSKKTKSSIYLKTTESNISPTRVLRNIRINFPKSPTKESNRTSIDSSNFLNRYKSLLPKIDKRSSLMKSKDDIVKSLEKHGVKSPNHKRNQTLNFLKKGDFYYLK